MPDQTRWDTPPPRLDMDSYRGIADALAAALLAGELETGPMTDRAAHLLGKRYRWIRPLAGRVVAASVAHTPPRQIEVREFLQADQGFARAMAKYDVTVVNWPDTPPPMNPVAEAKRWSLPALRSSSELAQWLKISVPDLEWFADTRRWGRHQIGGPLSHYRYRPVSKRWGQVRLIEAPKPRLKAIQRQILAEILERIPVHDCAHGFRRERSVKTFVQPHVARTVVIKIDLQDFFPSIAIARVSAIFRTAGFPEAVADHLAGLCSNSTPQDVWQGEILRNEGHRLRQVEGLYARPHLPQGAPSSPAIANLCAYRLDCRLSALAKTAGGIYTRYADDLAFSGGAEFARGAKRFQLHVCATIMEEGFRIHHRKTRIMRQGVCQRLAGIVLNEHINLPRRDIDRLKATLTNCIRYGPETQNRDKHADFREYLSGKISYVEMINPGRGQRLRELFRQIAW